MRGHRLGYLVVAFALGAAMVAGIVAADTAPSGPPTSTGTGGAAATVETLATQAAIDALRKGGNAVDAAVVAAAVLGVTEPFSAGIGGGGFMLIYEAGEKKPITIDHRERAPAAMRPDSFFSGGAPLPFNDARYSGLSVGVPGTVLGWERALKKHGTISLAEALAPAIAIARNGFVVDQVFADQIQGNLDFFNDIPATAALYLDPDGTPRDVGSVFRNPDLARTYELLAAKGHKGFYRNELAQAIVDTVTHPQVAANANHVWRPGVMTLSDLRGYTAPQRPATHVDLSRARRLRHGPALERRLDRRRGAEHPRGLPARGHDAASGRSTTTSRPRASRSPTAAPTWPTRTSSTCRCAACSPRSSPPRAAP